MLKPQELRDRQYRSLTGASKKEFEKLLPNFIVTYNEMIEEDYETNKDTRQRKPGGGSHGKLFDLESKLFFILYFFKNYPTYDVLGAIFDMSGSNAWKNVFKLSPVLEGTLRSLGVCPARDFFNIEEFKEFMQEEEDIFIDATVRPHFRHKDNETQKEYYDGKKKGTQ